MTKNNFVPKSFIVNVFISTYSFSTLNTISDDTFYDKKNEFIFGIG